jgi:hypothetical protein
MVSKLGTYDALLYELPQKTQVSLDRYLAQNDHLLSPQKKLK